MKAFLLIGFLASSLTMFSQCEIYNRLASNGDMLYYMEPIVLYWSSAKELQGNIVTDKTNYFLEFQPGPFPPKSAGIQFKEHLEVILANKKIYQLQLHEAQYIDDNSALQLLYLINKNDLPDFVSNQIIDITIYMGKQEGIRNYSLSLHKTLLQEQLSCFLKEEKN